MSWDDDPTFIMCFEIPLKIVNIEKNNAVMEDGRVVRLGEIQAKKNDYLLVYANIAVEKMQKTKALAARRLIKNSK